MATKQELFTKVTGLTFDVEKYLESHEPEQLAWLIPDGAMLDGEGRKKDDTLALLEELGLDKESKFSTADIEYDDEDPSENDSSNI